MKFRLMKCALFSVALVGCLILGFMAGSFYIRSRTLTDKLFSGGRFSQLRAALLIYHEYHGSFPPTQYQHQPEGPIHSWRVLLATSQDDKSNYDYALPWNSPSNLQALEEYPYDYSRVFSMKRHSDNGITHYLAVGDNDDWPGSYPSEPLQSLLVIKGEDRFLVVESPYSDIHWMEPRY